MANHVAYDTDKRIIYVTTSPTLIDGDWVIELDVKIDLYSDIKEDMQTLLSGFKMPVRPVGGDPLPGSKSLGATYFLDSLWKIRPYEGDHVFKINGNLYSEDGTSPFTQTIGNYNIMVINTVSSLVDSTVQQLAEIEYASFNGAVTVDLANGYDGTDKTQDGIIIGTPRAPSGNMIDALTIAQTRGFTTFFIVGDATIDNGQNYTGMIFIGESPAKSEIIVNNDADVTECEFYECHLTGVLDGQSTVRMSKVANINYLNGTVFQCILEPGTITLGGTETAHFLDCWSGVPGLETPTIDYNGSGRALAIRNYNGGIKIINKTGDDKVSIDLNSGQVILDDTVTAGQIVVRGIGAVYDKDRNPISTGTWNGGVDLDTDGLMAKDTIASAVLASDITDYEDPVTVGNMFASTAYQGIIYINTDSGSSGQQFPIGTRDNPVDNVVDAKVLMEKYGASTIFVYGSLTIPAMMECHHKTIMGSGGYSQAVVIEDGATFDRCIFKDKQITGTISGVATFERCKINNLSGINGKLTDCIIAGDNTFVDDISDVTHLIRCRSDSSTTWPSIDFGNSAFNVTNYLGLLQVSGKDGINELTLHGQLGYFHILDTCTAGAIIISGRGRYIDQSSVGCAVNYDYLHNTDIQAEKSATAVWSSGEAQELLSIEGGKWVIENYQMIFYEPDNVTEIMRFNLFDENSQPTNTNVFSRVRV